MKTRAASKRALLRDELTAHVDWNRGDAITRLLDANPDFDPNGGTPSLITLAFERQSKLAFRALYSNPRVDVTERDFHGNTFLHSVKRLGKDVALDFIRKRGPELAAAKNRYGDDALTHELSSQPFDADVVRALLAAGCDPNTLGSTKKSSLGLAVCARLGDDEERESTRVEIVRTLLAYRANPDNVDSTGATALVSAVWLHHVSVVRALLEFGCDPNVPDAYGHVPLYMFLLSDHFDIETMNALLNAGADPNAKVDGVPMLIYATRFGNLVAARTLLDFPGIDEKATDDEGSTWKDTARGLGGEDFVENYEIDKAMVNVIAESESRDESMKSRPLRRLPKHILVELDKFLR
jgi:ankyrin repeat protein